MNESYIANKVRKLLHVEHPEALQRQEAQQAIADIILAMRGTIEDATIELENKLVRMLNLHLNQHLS